jgi:hypothetical protein
MLGKSSRLRDRVIPKPSIFRVDDEITAAPLAFIFFSVFVYIDTLSYWHKREFEVIHEPC